MMYEIPRATLIEIGRKAVGAVPELDEHDRAGLVRGTEDTEAVLLGGWWSDTLDCGCLVGNYVGPDAAEEMEHIDPDAPLVRVGDIFDDLLFVALRERYGNSITPYERVEVIG